MSETPRDQRELWREVSRTFEEFGEALRVHLSPDAARSPSDPTTPWPSAAAGSPGGPGEGADASDSERVGSAKETEPAPWADPARPGEAEGFEDPWAAATDTPPRGTSASGNAGTSGTTATGTDAAADATAAGPASGATGTGPAAATAATTAATTAGGQPEAGPTGPTGTGQTGIGPTGTGATGAGTGRTGAAGTGGTGASGTGASGTGASGTGASGTGASGTGASGAGGGQQRGWREWGGSGSGGRFAGPADWDSARESVRDLSSSVHRIATQAGDAARDPHVRDSAQRAARTLGDAIVTTVEDIAAELRERMRNPRWSDPSTPPEQPPVAPIEDSRDDKP